MYMLVGTQVVLTYTQNLCFEQKLDKHQFSTDHCILQLNVNHVLEICIHTFITTGFKIRFHSIMFKRSIASF